MFAFGLARQSNKYKPLELRWTAHSSYSYTKMQPKTGWPQQMRCRIQCRRLAKSWARRPSLGTGCFPGFSVQRLAPVYSWCCTCGRYNSRSSSSSNCCCRCILYCCTWCRWNSLSFERVFVLFVGVWVWHQWKWQRKNKISGQLLFATHAYARMNHFSQNHSNVKVKLCKCGKSKKSIKWYDDYALFRKIRRACLNTYNSTCSGFVDILLLPHVISYFTNAFW